MPVADFTPDKSLTFRTPPPIEAARPKQSHFRVHLADGTKHDVSAACADDASRHVGKRFPSIKITKTKLIRETGTA